VAFPHRDLPAVSSGGDPADEPAVGLISSSHDVLAPAALLDAAPGLRGFGAVCVTEVHGHTSSRAPEFAELVQRFLETGDSGAASSRCFAAT
jgi:hypothetical protein